jgi:hypothetical protein
MTRPTPIDTLYSTLSSVATGILVAVLVILCLWDAVPRQMDIETAQTSAWLAEHPGAGR